MPSRTDTTETEGARDGSSVAWLFPGQGSQEVGMARDLFDGSRAARRVFETADDILGYPLSELCFHGPDERLQQTEQAQPAIFAASIACLEAARELGGPATEDPSFIAGHSLGEYTALVAARALGLEDGLRLVAERGRLMQLATEASPGAMAAILGLEEAAVRAICEEAGAQVCNLNAPGQVVIGGTAEAVDGAMALALERGAQRGVRLKVNGAFHTAFMQPAADGMAKVVAATPLSEPQVPVVANTTAEPITTAAQLREELFQQLTQPVQWQRTVECLHAHGVRSVIEFGAGRVLTGLVRRINRHIGVRNVTDMKSARALAAPIEAPP